MPAPRSRRCSMRRASPTNASTCFPRSPGPGCDCAASTAAVFRRFAWKENACRSCAIARALDLRWPDPPLFPTEPTARARVEEIEAWGEGPLQSVARRIILWALLHDRAAARAFLDGARLQFRCPPGLAAALAWPVLRADAAL